MDRFIILTIEPKTLSKPSLTMANNFPLVYISNKVPKTWYSNRLDTSNTNSYHQKHLLRCNTR